MINKFTGKSGALSLFYTGYQLVMAIPDINYVTTAVSMVCVFTLLLFKLYLNDKFKQWCHCNVPFPIELVVVILGTVVSFFYRLEDYDVKIAGPIPTGLPLPSAIDWSLVPRMWSYCLPLAIVAFALTYSIGKLFGGMHGYTVGSNTELLALGLVNFVGGFFFVTPSAASMSRSAVQEAAGGKTQLAGLVQAACILSVLLALGALLEKLPTCVLAAIICVALKSLLLQVLDVPKHWRINKLDCSIWLVTFGAVFILGIDTGLYIGIAYSLVTLIYKSQRPKSYLLAPVTKSLDIFVPVKKYDDAQELPRIKIFQFCGPLHFANIDYFQVNLLFLNKN